MQSYIPTQRLFLILGLLALEGIACFAWDWVALLWLTSLFALVLTCFIDWWCLRQCSIHLESFKLYPQPTVQQPFTFQLTLFAKMGATVRVALNLEAVQSDQLYLESEKANVDFEKNKLIARWTVTPKERGNLEWPGSLISLKTPLGLIIHWQLLEPIHFKVYPKLNQNLQTLLSPDLLLEQLGLKTHRFKRADHVFESLRPYILGDNYRDIDWKASARSNCLVTRQFQMEQHHNILVCLDSSRLMGTTTKGISKLDWAIEATLHLAYLAEYLNDRISLMVFSRDVDLWIKPHKAPVDSFLKGLYDVKSQIVEADLNQVCAQILATQKKRSLVIFLSDFIDASSVQPFLSALGHLNHKHCSLFIGIEDPAYKKYLSDHVCVASALNLSRLIVAQDSMNRRDQLIKQFRQMGLRALTTSPERLVQQAMSSYLEIKLQGAI